MRKAQDKFSDTTLDLHYLTHYDEELDRNPELSVRDWTCVTPRRVSSNLYNPSST